MKITTASLKFPALATAVAIVIASAFAIRTAQAGYIVTLQQVGPNVVATGTGTIDYTDLTPEFSNVLGPNARMYPDIGLIVMGSTVPVQVDRYTGFTGPTNFGSGGLTLANNGSGDQVGLSHLDDDLIVPTGYVSGNALLKAANLYSGQTFATLGVKPGTYTWTWGTGVHADSFTLIASLPDSGSTLGLLLLSLAGLFAVNRFRPLHLA